MAHYYKGKKAEDEFDEKYGSLEYDPDKDEDLKGMSPFFRDMVIKRRKEQFNEDKKEARRKYKNNFAKRLKERMDMWCGRKVGNVSYWDVRKLMLDTGLLSTLQGGTVMGTVGVALPILKAFVDNGWLDRGSTDAHDTNAMHSLMWGFFKFAGITGYDWNNANTDNQAQAAFAQSFLEYIHLNVTPLWNQVELLLTRDITKPSEETEKGLATTIDRLLGVFNKEALFKFLQQHLRFPNMNVKVIDYGNATPEQAKLLDKYRQQMGIPTPAEKSTLL